MVSKTRSVVHTFGKSLDNFYYLLTKELEVILLILYHLTMDLVIWVPQLPLISHFYISVIIVSKCIDNFINSDLSGKDLLGTPGQQSKPFYWADLEVNFCKHFFYLLCLKMFEIWSKAILTNYYYLFYLFFFF